MRSWSTITAALVVVGCSGTAGVAETPKAPSHAEFASESGGFSVSMPTPVRQRQAWEGPVQMVLAASEDPAGAIFEATYFELPGELTDEEKIGLADRVIRGLSGGPGVRIVGIEEEVTAGEPSIELALAIAEQRLGTWRLFFVRDQRMFQLSVVGPADGHHDGRADRFFESFRLKAAADPPSGLELAAAFGGSGDEAEERIAARSDDLVEGLSAELGHLARVE